MALAHTITERRRLPRVEFPGRVEIDMLSAQRRLAADSINLNEGGICARIQEAVEISSPVRLRLFTRSVARPMECGGRIAWVIQRLDLRDIPPFVYDIGVEFVNPPARLREFASRIGVTVKTSPRTIVPAIRPLSFRNRQYTPRVQHEPSPSGRWHLVVTVDGTPCFSGRYASEREALQAWDQFQRRASKEAGIGSRSPTASRKGTRR